MSNTLTALSQRNEAFWIGASILVLGLVTPETISLWGVALSRTLVFLGGGILLVRVFVAIFRILKTTVRAGVLGYSEGKRSER